MSSFIHKIQYNWTPLSYDYCEVGKEGKYGIVRSIEEHRSNHSQDKPYFNVNYDDGIIERIYNINSVVYKKRGN